MSDPSDIDDVAVWKALADPSRRRLLDLLRAAPRTTGELAQAFEVSRFAVMKHLEVLVEANLVCVVRQGRQRWNHLNPVPLRQVVERWLSPFEGAAAAALLRLKRVAEEEAMSLTAPTLSAYELRLEIPIKASRAKVWRALIADIGRWWPAHFYSVSGAKNFVIEPHVGGRVYEDRGDGMGGLWATVVLFQPEEKLQWSGDIFPDFGGIGRYFATFTLVEKGKQTILHFHDGGFGILKAGHEDSLRSGWQELFGEHLRKYAESL